MDGAGLGSGSGSERDLGIERRKNREIKARHRWEFKLLASMILMRESTTRKMKKKKKRVLVMEVFVEFAVFGCFRGEIGDFGCVVYKKVEILV